MAVLVALFSIVERRIDGMGFALCFDERYKGCIIRGVIDSVCRFGNKDSTGLVGITKGLSVHTSTR